MRSPRTRATVALRGGIARETRSVLFGGARRRRTVGRFLSVIALISSALLMATVPPARALTPPPEASVGFPFPPGDDGIVDYPSPLPPIGWRDSLTLGRPWAGRLVRGVQLPEQGPDWFTFNGVHDVAPNPGFRRWGSDALVRTVIRVLREYRSADPAAPRVGIGDLSRRHGGAFGKAFGGLGHASHQNGLDVDVWYPRTDGLERRASRVSLVDRARSQALVDRFVAAGAENVFVGPHVGLTGPRRIVVRLVHHDDHLHVRIPSPPR